MSATPSRAARQEIQEYRERLSTSSSVTMPAPSPTDSGFNAMLEGVTISEQQTAQEANPSPSRTRSGLTRGEHSARPAGQKCQLSQTESSTPFPLTSQEENVTVPDPALHYILRIAIDYGTFNLNVMYQLEDTDYKDTDVDNNDHPIRALEFEHGNTDSPMWLYVDENGTFDWGHSVQERFENKEILFENIIRQPKLAMHTGDDRGGLKLVKKQIKSLGHGFNLVKLVREHIKAVERLTLSRFKESLEGLRLIKEGVDFTKLRKEIHLGVPQAWDPASNEIMSTAAFQAKFRGQLVVEPQCVAAFAIHSNNQRHDKQQLYRVTGGDDKIRQLVVDAGGGTVDLIKFEMSAIGDAKTKLKTIGKPRGELIGSALINDDFVDQIYKGRVGFPAGISNVTELLSSLGMTDGSLRAQASQKFERLKTEFPKISDGEAIRLNGTNSQHVDPYIKVPKYLVAECIQRGIDKVFALVDKLIDPETKVMIVSGGWGQSHSLKTALKDRYGPDVYVLPAELPSGSLSLPVAHGALLRHDKVELEALPSGFSYFTTQDHDYDPIRHPDAVENPRLILPSKWAPKNSSARVVTQRITNLLKTTDELLDKTSFIQATVFSFFSMMQEDPTISAEIYWSKQDLKEDSGLQDYRSPERYPRNPEYRLWKSVKVKVTREKLELKGYKAKKIRDGSMAYHVSGQIVLKASGAAMEVIFRIANSGKTHLVKENKTGRSMYLEDLPAQMAWSSEYSHTTPADPWLHENIPDIASEGDYEERKEEEEGEEAEEEEVGSDEENGRDDSNENVVDVSSCWLGRFEADEDDEEPDIEVKVEDSYDGNDGNESVNCSNSLGGEQHQLMEPFDRNHSPDSLQRLLAPIEDAEDHTLESDEESDDETSDEEDEDEDTYVDE